HRFVGLWQDQGRAAARAEPGIYFALGSADAAFHCCPSRSNRPRRPVCTRAADCATLGSAPAGSGNLANDDKRERRAATPRGARHLACAAVVSTYLLREADVPCPI